MMVSGMEDFKMPSGRSVSEIVDEYKKLHERLAQIEQQEDESAAEGLRTELAPISKGLIEGRWLLHRDKTVRLFVACCLSQILRLFAPEAPYEGEDLARVFGLFGQQLRGLSEPTGAYYGYYFGLLEGLSTVKSIVLVWQIEENGQRDLIITDVFKTAYTLVHPTLNKTVKVYLLELLDAVIGECPAGQGLPSEVFEETILKGLENDKEPHLIQFTGELVQLAGERLGGMFSRHFNEILVGHSTQPAFEAVKKVHGQMVQIAKFNAEAVQPVLSQISHELLLEETELRTLSLITLGRIFGVTGTGHGYGQVWTSWLGRRNDRVAGVRGQWIALASDLLSKLRDTESISSLSNALSEKLLDPEERVRERVLLALLNVEGLECIPRSLLEKVSERSLDRREEVRVAALTLLCKLLSHLDIQSDLSISISERQAKWSFLPLTVFKMLYTDDNDSRLLFEYFIEHSVLRNSDPSDPLPTQLQAARWIWIWSCLDEQGRIGLKAWIRAKSVFVKLVTGLVQFHRAGIPKESRQINVISQSLVEKFRTPSEALKMISALWEVPELMDSIGKLVDPNTELEETYAILEELHQYAGNVQTFVLVYLAQRCSWASVNRSLVTQLLQWSTLHESIPSLIDLLMTELPVLAETHGDYLVSACELSSFTAPSLKALIHFCRTSTNDLSRLIPELKNILVRSEDLSKVKQACRLLLLIEPSIAPSLLEQAASDTAHPTFSVHSKAWQILRVLGRDKPALLPPYLDELLLEYELVLSTADEDRTDEFDALFIISTKFWASLLPQLDPATLPKDREKPLRSELLDAAYNVLKPGSPGCLKILVLVLEGPRMNLTTLLERPTLYSALTADSESILGKTSALILSHRTSPIILLPILLQFCSAKDKTKIGHLSHVLRTWSRSQPALIDEDEHLIDSSTIHIPEDLLVPYLTLLAYTNTETPYTADNMKPLIYSFFEHLLPLTQDNLSYLFALAVEVKRYMPATFLDTTISAKLIYLASELTQAAIRHKATLLHCSLQAFPLPIRITDHTFTPLDAEVAKRNLAKSYLNKHKMKKEQKAIASYISKKRREKPSTSSLTASPNSERRKNPGRSAKLPPGCIEAIMDDLAESENYGEEMFTDEIENQNGIQNLKESLPWKRKNMEEVDDFSIDICEN